jgi:nitric oxide synthase oxygenase domain/subunit
MSRSALPIVLVSEAESSGKCYRPAPLSVVFLRKNVRSICIDEETIDMLVNMMRAMELSTSTGIPVCKNQRLVATADCGSCCR